MSHNPNAYHMAMRDAAKAALLGALPSDFGMARTAPSAAASLYDVSPMGGETSFGDDFSGDFAGYADGTMGFGGFGASPAPPPNHPAHPAHPAHHAHVAAVVHAHTAKMAHTASRARLLEPNAGSEIKVERYDFSLNQAIVLGTALNGFQTTLQPSVKIRPQRFLSNVPIPFMVTLTQIQVANVQALVGASTDANFYGPGAFASVLDLPTLDPANRATVGGNYNGILPPGFNANQAATLVFTFQGPATITA